jgi:hypothetical protein
MKRVFSPRAPLFPKKTTKELAALWTLGKGVDFGCFYFLSCVIGLDVRNGSGEHSVFRRLLSVVEVTWLGYMLGTVSGEHSVFRRLLSVVEINIHKIGEER